MPVIEIATSWRWRCPECSWRVHDGSFEGGYKRLDAHLFEVHRSDLRDAALPDALAIADVRPPIRVIRLVMNPNLD